MSRVLFLCPGIRYNRAKACFVFGDNCFSPDKISMAIAHGLLSGEKLFFRFSRSRTGVCASYGVSLSAKYQTEMLEFAGQHGWFWDEVREHNYASDHQFNGDQITPGLQWTKVCRMMSNAGRLEEKARACVGSPDESYAAFLNRAAACERRSADKVLQDSNPTATC
ncbi:MAG: hypothetical protein K2W95_33415 [Candidatus Obscuribacterales bacterium]|nr:hypothetical protein [Candidatus Obscuribacterales bacterium]